MDHTAMETTLNERENLMEINGYLLEANQIKVGWHVDEDEDFVTLWKEDVTVDVFNSRTVNKEDIQKAIRGYEFNEHIN